MEASALQAPARLTQPKGPAATPVLRFRSDEQLVALFRAGHDEAFRAIHDRYHKRLFAYARQMLPARQDAEDALQDVFVRAYSGLRASDRELALRAWLFRVAHNRCIDELRRPAPPPPDVLYLVRSTVHDPLAEVDLRDSLRRLVADIRRLPDQQRSALLMRELAGMSYADISASLGSSIAAVKSLLVRARIALAQAAEARDTACVVVRDELVGAHDRGVRPNANARRHIRDCAGCKSFRRELRSVTRQLAAIGPGIGPLGFLAKMLGLSGGAGGGVAGGAGAGGGAAVVGGGGVTATAGGLVVGANHVATLIVAAVAAAGGALEIQHTVIPPTHHAAHVRSAPPKASRDPAPIPATADAANGVKAVVAVVAANARTTGLGGGSPAASARKPKVQPSAAGGAAVGPSTGATNSSSSATGGAPAATRKGLSGVVPGTGSASTTTDGAACPSSRVPETGAAADGSSSSSPSATPAAATSITSTPSSSTTAATSTCGTTTGSSPSAPTASGSTAISERGGTGTTSAGSGSGSGSGTASSSSSSNSSSSSAPAK